MYCHTPVLLVCVCTPTYVPIYVECETCGCVHCLGDSECGGRHTGMATKCVGCMEWTLPLRCDVSALPHLLSWPLEYLGQLVITDCVCVCACVCVCV